MAAGRPNERPTGQPLYPFSLCALHFISYFPNDNFKWGFHFGSLDGRSFLSIWFTLFYAGLTYQQSACENCISDIYGSSYVFVTVYYYAKNLIWWPEKKNNCGKNWNRKLFRRKMHWNRADKCVNRIEWRTKMSEARRDGTRDQVNWRHTNTDHAVISIIGKNLFKYLNGLHSLRQSLLFSVCYLCGMPKIIPIPSEVFFDRFIFLAYAFLQWLVWMYRTSRDRGK